MNLEVSVLLLDVYMPCSPDQNRKGLRASLLVQ